MKNSLVETTPRSNPDQPRAYRAPEQPRLFALHPVRYFGPILYCARCGRRDADSYVPETDDLGFDTGGSICDWCRDTMLDSHADLLLTVDFEGGEWS